MQYRKELDGLRAIAVTAVIGFHAGLKPFSGGFVGVDIFFVLSGFLISLLLIESANEDRFSFLDFYERRARRILPAFAVVIVASAIFAWYWMTPVELQRFAASVLSVSLFYSNHYFLSHHAYFSPLTEEMPLLHTWSLAVEEQFYFVFPLLFVGLLRVARSHALVAILLLACSSFVLAVWVGRSFPTDAFYWAATRAWQLSAGVACALIVAGGKRPEANRVLAGTGLAAIALAVTLFEPAMAGPGVYSLLPVVGACLIILFAAESNGVGWLLASRPFVALGLVSYSAYLWHQPLFAFARLSQANVPSPWLMAALALGAFGLAAVTWKYVEMPLRRRGKDALLRRSIILPALAVTFASFAALAIIVHKGGGVPSRLAPGGQSFSALQLDQRLESNMGLGDICEDNFTLDTTCRTSSEPEIAVWGDSYAMHLVDGLLASSPDPKIIQHTKSKCAPILGVALIDAETSEGWAQQCIAFNQQVLDWLSQSSRVKVVVLSSPFWGVLENALLVEGEGIHSDGQRKIIADRLKATVQRLQAIGKRVMVIAPPPNTGSNIGRCLGKTTMYGLAPEACNFPPSAFTTQFLDVMNFLTEARQQGLPVISLNDAICGPDQCKAIEQGKFIYRDSGHLSHEGSRLLGSKLKLYEAVMAQSK